MNKYATTMIINALRNKDQDLSQLEKTVKENSQKYSIIPTYNPNEVKGIIERAFFDGYLNIIVFVGGDTTLHYVVNETMNIEDKPDFVIAAIPYKYGRRGKTSGNDFSGPVLNICNREEGIDALRHFYKNPKNIVYADVGLFQVKDQSGKNIFEKYFIHSAGGGQSGLANRYREKLKIGYTLAGILAALKGPYNMKIKINGRTYILNPYDRERLFNINNGPEFGNGILIAPDANPSDGVYDATIVENCNFFKVLFLLLMAKKGKDVVKKSNRIHYFKDVKKLEVEADKPFPIQIDGEDYPIHYPDSNIIYSIEHTGKQLPFVKR